MRILYAFDSPVPETGADTEQLVNTVAALARQGLTLELLVPGPVTGPGDPAALHEYYQVAGEFAVHQLALRWQGLRGPEKWSHALRAARHPATRAADLVFLFVLNYAGGIEQCDQRQKRLRNQNPDEYELDESVNGRRRGPDENGQPSGEQE